MDDITLDGHSAIVNAIISSCSRELSVSYDDPSLETLIGDALEKAKQDDYEDYSQLAVVIVEPTFTENQSVIQEEYAEYIENNTDNWAAWVRQTFGNALGNLADAVNEYGY